MQSVFCIDICASAIMNNHYHVVLHVNVSEADALTDLEVLEGWCGLFKGSVLTKKYRQGGALTQAESKGVCDRVQEWRERLTYTSWFIRCCNEWLARESNKEDLFTGRFWEGRFKSLALLDEKALTACMAYVDLNPLRAKMAKTPESSGYTSVKTRDIKAKGLKKELKNPNYRRSQPINLFPFVGNPRENMPVGLPFKLEDYLELVD